MKTVLAAALAALIALPAAARADGPATMRFAFPQGPKSYVYTAGVVPWSKAVTVKSGGAVDIKLFPGPQLANVFTFKLQDVTHHHFAVPFGLAPTFIIMNRGAWDRLPAQAQKAFDSHSGERLSRQVATAGIKADTAIQHRLAKMPGQEVSELGKAELARWKTAFQPIVDAWVKATPDGAHVLGAFEAEMAKVRSGM